MRRTRGVLVIAVVIAAVQSSAQAPAPQSAAQRPAAPQSTALNDITFTWPQQPNKDGLSGFGHTPEPEVGRYDTLTITVTPEFTKDVATQFGGSTSSPLVTELNAFTALAVSLNSYLQTLGNLLSGPNHLQPEKLLDNPEFRKASTNLGATERQFVRTMQAVDPALLATITQTFAAPAGGTKGDQVEQVFAGYRTIAQALKQGIDTLNGRLQVAAKNTGALGMTATIIPLEADARVLHLPGYDTNPELATAAVPNTVPLVDARTQAEIEAAQQLIKTTKELTQLPAETKKAIEDAKAALDALKQTLLANLDANLATIEQQIASAAKTDLAPLLAEVKAARAIIANLSSANPNLPGDDDGQRLLNLATSLSSTADALIAAFGGLDLNKLANDVEAAVKKGAVQIENSVIADVRSAGKEFAAKQTFFMNLAADLKILAKQFGPNSLAVMSAERMEATARSFDTPANLSTSLDVAKIPGAVNVNDRIEIDAAIYRRDAASGKLQEVSTAHQTFVIERYGIYPDNVRGGLIFVQPRSKIERDINYQPTVALGYYWRYGHVGWRGWNANSPSVGFTVTLLDFEDKSNMEVGIAGGVSLFRDLFWTGYGRNLQAKANYFYVGVNALALGKMITNR